MCSGFFPSVRTSVSVISRTIVAFCSRVAPFVICTFTYGIFEPALSAVPEKNHVAFLHDIFLPLQPHLRLLPRRRQTPPRQQIIPPHNFRANKSLLDVAVNRSRRLDRRRSLANRPRPHFR